MKRQREREAKYKRRGKILCLHDTAEEKDVKRQRDKTERERERQNKEGGKYRFREMHDPAEETDAERDRQNKENKL